MAKVYLPTEYLNMPCKVINENYIRVYHTISSGSNNNTVTDIYFKSDYITRRTTATYTAGTTLCDTTNTYTDNFYYRYDITNVFLNVLILTILGIFLPIKIFSKLFKRGSL